MNQNKVNMMEMKYMPMKLQSIRNFWLKVLKVRKF